MEKQIRGLDDATAIRVLRSLAQARIRRGPLATELDRPLREALEQQFPVASAAASEGGLARAALLLVVQDPQHRGAIEALIAGPPPQSMGVLAGIAVVTAALVALQTHVLVERDKQGRVQLKIEHRPMSDGLLKEVIAKLFGRLVGWGK